MQWTRLRPAAGSPTPGGCNDGVLEFDATFNRLILFGGKRTLGLANSAQTWQFHLDNSVGDVQFDAN
jgi:hypothetical protein